MQVYRLTCGTDKGVHYATRDDAHDAAKESVWRHDQIFVDLIDVQVDKEGVVALMNGEPLMKTLRSWTLTARKGLKEIEVE